MAQVHGAPPSFPSFIHDRVVQQSGSQAFNLKTRGQHPSRLLFPAHVAQLNQQRHGVESAASAGATPAVSTIFLRIASIAAMHRTFNPASTGRHRGGPPFHRPLVKQNHSRPPSGSRGGGTFTGDHYFAAVRTEILRSSIGRAVLDKHWERVRIPPERRQPDHLSFRLSPQIQFSRQ